MFKAAACLRNSSVVQKGGHFSTDLSQMKDFQRALHKTEKSIIISELIHPSAIFRTQPNKPHPWECIPASASTTPPKTHPVAMLSCLKTHIQPGMRLPITRKKKSNSNEKQTNSKGTQPTNLCRQIQEETSKQGSCKFTVHVRLAVLAKPFY